MMLHLGLQSQKKVKTFLINGLSNITMEQDFLKLRSFLAPH
jgi:hypothetical protein